MQTENNWLDNIGDKNYYDAADVCEQESEKAERSVCGTSDFLRI